jgi:transcription initiation factor TFIID subunit 6
MPTLLTCVVGKRLSETFDDDHWSLRQEASRLIAYICLKYGDAYPNLQPRILKTLMKAIMMDEHGGGSSSSATLNVSQQKGLAGPKYGAIVCLKDMGIDSVELFLLPNIKKIAVLTQSYSEMEAEKCQLVLLVHITFN